MDFLARSVHDPLHSTGDKLDFDDERTTRGNLLVLGTDGGWARSCLMRGRLPMSSADESAVPAAAAAIVATLADGLLELAGADYDAGVEPVMDFGVELHFEVAVVAGGAKEGIGPGFGGLADYRAVDDALGGSEIVLSPALQSLAVE